MRNVLFTIQSAIQALGVGIESRSTRKGTPGSPMFRTQHCYCQGSTVQPKKKKKNLVEEKHPGDKGGCERDNRTREIRDGRRGEERGIEGQWTERRHKKCKTDHLFYFIGSKDLSDRDSPLPKFFISPYTHLHTHTSSCHT